MACHQQDFSFGDISVLTTFYFFTLIGCPYLGYLVILTSLVKACNRTTDKQQPKYSATPDWFNQWLDLEISGVWQKVVNFLARVERTIHQRFGDSLFSAMACHQQDFSFGDISVLTMFYFFTLIGCLYLSCLVILTSLGKACNQTTDKQQPKCSATPDWFNKWLYLEISGVWQKMVNFFGFYSKTLFLFLVLCYFLNLPLVCFHFY